MRVPLLLLLVAAALGACVAGPPAGSTGPSARPTARALAALDDSLARRPGARTDVLRRALVRGGVSPLGDPGRRSGPVARYETVRGRAASGFVPGGDPLVRGELVVLGAPADAPEAAAVAVAALVLAERSRWTGQPDRTVQVVFWPGTPPDAPRRALDAALWPAARVRAVVLVGAAPADSVGGAAVVGVPRGEGGLPLAEALLEATLRAARAPASSDSLDSPR